METGRGTTYYSASVGSVAISRFLGVSQLPPYVRRVIPPSKKPFLGLGIKWILGVFLFDFWFLFLTSSLQGLVSLKIWVDNLGFSAVFVASLPSISVVYSSTSTGPKST